MEERDPFDGRYAAGESEAPMASGRSLSTSAILYLARSELQRTGAEAVTERREP